MFSSQLQKQISHTSKPREFVRCLNYLPVGDMKMKKLSDEIVFSKRYRHRKMSFFEVL